ncbi:MAG: peptidoglycan editing factor PgeF [Polyangiaceae bacterium]
MSGIAKESELLLEAGFVHAFFTRRGGVSEGAYDSLNFAGNTGDSPEAVRENLAIAAKSLGVEASKLFFLSQVHGADGFVIDGAEDRDEVVHRRGDWIATGLARKERLACGVRSADCGVVLIGDRTSRAVCAIHAGWRGTVAGVIATAVRAFRARLSADADLVAAVGPLIEVCCFEVDEPVAAELAACSPLGQGAIERDWPKPHVDLRRILEVQLADAGVSHLAIDHVGGCTVCAADTYFSYRRDGAASGRMLSAIVAEKL